MDIYLENVHFGLNDRVQANVNKEIFLVLFREQINSDKYKHLTPIRDAHLVPP